MVSEMRIYPKKLRNIEDIEREEALLQKKSRELDKEEFFSFNGLLSKKKAKGKKKEKPEDEDEDGERTWIDLLPISNPLTRMVVKMGWRTLTKRNNPKMENYSGYAHRKYRRIKLKAIAFEFIGGYLKWKAIELSYKGIRHIIRKRREKKAEEIERNIMHHVST